MLELGRVGKPAGVGREDGHDADEQGAGQGGERAQDQRRERRNPAAAT
jgi:hypothetical protein